MIEGTDTEKACNGKSIHGESRRVLPPRDEYERDGEAYGDHERAEMKQPSKERPRQPFREQVRLGHRATRRAAGESGAHFRTHRSGLTLPLMLAFGSDPDHVPSEAELLEQGDHEG